MGKIISFIGTKGGVGKSTLTLTLAFSTSFQSMTRCIVDADPQASIANWFEERKNAGLQIDVEVIHLCKDNLSTELDRLSSEYELVLLDCPGESEAYTRTRTAMVKSDVVVIPVKTGDFDMASVVNHIIPLIEPAKEASERNTKYFLLPSMIHYAANKEKTIKSFEGTPASVLNAVFPFRKIYQDFPSSGLTLSEYGNQSNKAIKKQVIIAEKEVDAIGSQLSLHLSV